MDPDTCFFQKVKKPHRKNKRKRKVGLFVLKYLFVVANPKVF